MKKNLNKATLFVAFVLFTIGAATSSAQMIVGGYGEISGTDKTVVSAADFAVKARNKAEKKSSLKLISIERAERQIVAGANYRMCLNVSSNGKNEQASATVYLNLQNQFSLSDWTAGKCAGDEANQTMKSGDEDDETVTYEGKLEIGKTDSTILYVGEETGDYAAFCFTNNSKVGRAILAACKNGEQCEFTGQVNFESPCKVKKLEASLSASGKITSIKSVKSLAKNKRAMSNAATPKNSAVAPHIVVKNLYAARKSEKDDPFFQTKDRARLDKYFSKDLADKIWKDSIKAKGEIGAIDFDPLYGLQDSQVSNFTVMETGWGGDKKFGGDDEAVVQVTFKYDGKERMVSYQFRQDKDKAWKIYDIHYRIDADEVKLTDVLNEAN